MFTILKLISLFALLIGQLFSTVGCEVKSDITPQADVILKSLPAYSGGSDAKYLGEIYSDDIIGGGRDSINI